MGDDGYGVDKKGMKDLAGKLRECGSDLNQMETPLRSHPCVADEMGEFATGAFANFYGAWCQETDVIMDALGELATKLEQSEGSYSSIDSAHGAVFGKAIVN
jgi:uncharacterized protein YukE